MLLLPVGDWRALFENLPDSQIRVLHRSQASR
jgi:hypothetical protein